MSPEILQHIKDGLLFLIGLILSIAVHEFGHAFVGDKLGDPLPRAQGRVTLNPIAHIDPIGTLVIPMIQFFQPGLPLLGWGRPVQVSLSARHLTRRFSTKMSHAFIAIAGPMMNVLFALLLSAIFVVLLYLGQTSFGFYIGKIIELNFVLAFFNLIPCPPLDGGAILHGIIPRDLEWVTEMLQKYGFIILMALLFTRVLDHLLWPAEWAAMHWLSFLVGLVVR